jgi:hypothetical protein
MINPPLLENQSNIVRCRSDEAKLHVGPWLSSIGRDVDSVWHEIHAPNESYQTSISLYDQHFLVMPPQRRQMTIQNCRAVRKTLDRLNGPAVIDRANPDNPAAGRALPKETAYLSAAVLELLLERSARARLELNSKISRPTGDIDAMIRRGHGREGARRILKKTCPVDI